MTADIRDGRARDRPPAARPEPEPAEPEPSFERLAMRVDDAVKALAALDGPARAVAEELKAAVEAVHRAGLVTIVRRLRSEEATRPALYELVDDPTVHLLLSLHGIVRPDPVTLATRVLTQVRPQLQSHGGDVALVRIEGPVAYVRLEGACNGCSMSSVTLRHLVEEALVGGVPGITTVEVLPGEPSPALIPLSALRIGPGAADPDGLAADGWVKAAAVGELAEGKISTLSLGAAPGTRSRSALAAGVIVVNIGNRLTAYGNACAHEGMPLDNALLDATNGTLTCPWHGFCYDALSGECLSAPGAHLEQLPLRVEAGDVWIRVGT
ncbi:MAG TPA: NifU family protein [Actinocrinis sp.]|nr:NifU family protein [Actinocrinis sp.]